VAVAFRVDASRALRAVRRRVGAASPRETQVLECALAGDGREQTAYLIGCKPGTIATHWRRIFNKTGKPTKSDVLADAFRFLLDHGH
jgi:DNA-binding CsgD family transcriptional regulator